MYNFWFQGQLPTDVVQSFTRREDSGLKSSPASIEDLPETQSWSPKPGQSGEADVSAHEAESPSTVDLELTDSTSTGEVPSPVTFRLVPELTQCVQQWLSHVHSVYSSNLIPMHKVYTAVVLFPFTQSNLIPIHTVYTAVISFPFT